MFIEVQETPNPNTLKFVLTEAILQDNTTYHFKSKEDSKDSPLAYKLFEIEDVQAIFLGSNFVSVIINNPNDWDYLRPKILAYITEFVSTGQKVILEEANISNVVGIKGKNADEQDIIDKITELFEERIRPAVAMDGGDIIFKGYDDGVIFISMYGACNGCPSSTITLKNGIENMLKYYIPEVKEVVSIA